MKLQADSAEDKARIRRVSFGFKQNYLFIFLFQLFLFKLEFALMTHVPEIAPYVGLLSDRVKSKNSSFST